jgi:hypothetical protein
MVKMILGKVVIRGERELVVGVQGEVLGYVEEGARRGPAVLDVVGIGILGLGERCCSLLYLWF